MENLLNGDLSDVKIPFHEVEKFMNDFEDGLVNSDNKDFYKYLYEKDNFDVVQ